MRRVAVTVLTALALLLGVAGRSAALGGDPGLPQQWGLAQVGAVTAWARTQGAGTPVAIVDSGIDLAHEDLRGQILAAVTCVGTGGDPARCRPDGADVEGHGTHVAGIAAAASNGVGIAGVAPLAKLVSVRVFSQSGGSFSASAEDINAGIRWVIANIATKGVVNLSLGGDFLVTSLFGTSFADGIEEAWAAGWVPVLASGNASFLGLGSSNYGNLNALVVGATGRDGRMAPYSSPLGNAKWGLVAPGGDAGDCQEQPDRCVLSTYKDNTYGFLQGTSMATPHVSGAAALLMGAGLTNRAAVARILEGADKSVACGTGCHGRLDAARAVQLAVPGGATTVVSTTPAPAPPTAPPTTTAPASGGHRPVTTTLAPPAPAPAPESPPPAPESPAPDPAAGTAEAAGDPAAHHGLQASPVTGRRAAPGERGDVPLGMVAVAGAALVAVSGVTTARLRPRRPTDG